MEHLLSCVTKPSIPRNVLSLRIPDRKQYNCRYPTFEISQCAKNVCYEIYFLITSFFLVKIMRERKIFLKVQYRSLDIWWTAKAVPWRTLIACTFSDFSQFLRFFPLTNKWKWRHTCVYSKAGFRTLHTQCSWYRGAVRTRFHFKKGRLGWMQN